MMPRFAGSLLVLGATLATTGCDSCDKPKPAAEAGAASASSSSADAAPSTPPTPGILAAPGCRARTPGGTVLAGKLEPGNITIAVTGGKALVVNTVFKDPRKLDNTDPEGTIESAKSERVVLAANGLPDGPFEPIIEAHGADEGAATPLTWAVATTFHDELATMSYGTGRTGVSCSGGTLMLKGAGSPVYVLPDKHCRFASNLAGAGRGDIAVALLDGPTQMPITVKTWPAIVEAIVYFGGKAHSIQLESEGGGAGTLSRIEAPAAAVGKSLAALAYRVVRPGSRELHVTMLDISGKKVGKIEVLDKGDVGAPALAFEEDTLHVIWAARPPGDKDPYTLRWTKLSSTGVMSAPQRLSTGVGSAFAPALGIDERGRVLVAWMEGDDKKGIVKVGVSKRGMASAVALARAISNEGTNARDPEVGLDKNAMFLVWQEYGKTTQELRAASLECME